MLRNTVTNIKINLNQNNSAFDETLRALDDLVRQGKVMYIGVNEWTAELISEAVHLADKKLQGGESSSKARYSDHST